MNPRKPSKQEVGELVWYVAEQMGGFESNDNMDQAKGFVDSAAISVFDKYITDSPGYAGKLMTVVWPAAPSFYETFIWDRNGNIEHVNQDSGFVIKHDEEPF